MRESRSMKFAEHALLSAEPWPSGYRFTLRAFAFLSWVLAVFVTSELSIWNREHLEPSVFTMDTIIVEIFWILLFVVQGAYICYTSRNMAQLAGIIPIFDVHFIAHNVLHVAVTTLNASSNFPLAGIVLLLDFFNLSSAYRRSLCGSMLQHISVASGPLSWALVELLWNGAMLMPQRESMVAGILGAVCIWVIPGGGVFCGIAYKDYTMTFLFCMFSAAIGVGQYRLMVDNQIDNEHSIPLIILLVQCIFAFIIMSTLFVLTLGILLSRWLNREKPDVEGNEVSSTETPRGSHGTQERATVHRP